MAKTLKEKIKLALHIKKRILVALVGAVVLLSVAIRAPELHGLLLRAKVGSKTVMVKKSPDSGGGTGFYIEAPSGKTYIVTNSHVCDHVTAADGTVLIETPEGNYMRRRVLEVSDKSDLCLIESLPNKDGLSLGSEPFVGQIVASIGHPALMPTTISRGEIVGQEDVYILSSLIASQEQFDECISKPKNKAIAVFVFVACVTLTKDAYITNAVIQGGSSGSPVVNFWGNVVGVAFAADKANWARVVSLKDLKEFIKLY
jgi:S1-C subfamily serine protease